MGRESSHVYRFDLGFLILGQMRIGKFKSAFSSFIPVIGPRGLQNETKL